jgi:hypothetical protein
MGSLHPLEVVHLYREAQKKNVPVSKIKSMDRKAMKHIRRARQLLGFHSNIQTNYRFGAPKQGNVVSICLFLAHRGIMQPGIWNLFKKEFSDSQPKDSKLTFIVHCPTKDYRTMLESLHPADVEGWKHVSNIGMEYNEHTGWCKMSLLTVQLQCYFHILNNFGTETKGTVYLVSGYDIPIAPPQNMDDFTRSQLDCRCIKIPNVQWLALTFKTIKSVLELCKKPTRDVNLRDETLLRLAPRHKTVTFSYLEDAKSQFLNETNGSFYQFIVYLRNKLFHGEEPGEEPEESPFPCPDEVAICDIFIKHIDSTLLSDVDKQMPRQTADPRSLSAASPIQFGITDSDGQRPDVLANRYFNTVVLPEDYTNFPGIGRVAIPMTKHDYERYTPVSEWPWHWHGKVPDMPPLGLAQFGLEMHVLAVIATFDEKQPLFFRKVTSNGDVTESNFLRMLITNNGWIQIKKNIRQCAPFLMEIKDAFENGGEGELKTLITNAETLKECIKLEEEEKLFTNDNFEVYPSHNIRYHLTNYIFLKNDMLKDYEKFKDSGTDKFQFEKALHLDTAFRDFLSTDSKKRKHTLEFQAR